MKKERNRIGGRQFGRYDGLKYGWLRDTKKFIWLLLILLIFFHSVVGVSFVKGESMKPTLLENDLVLYIRINPHYERGDVVSVRIPSGEYYVKRIIAMEGDTIDIRDGKVYINGKRLTEPYTMSGTFEAEDGIITYPCTLTEGQIFVMGDNRPESMDSRDFGVLGTRQIKGRILFRAGKISAY